ncbi:MAG: ABC transporter ATP-binding protein [Candidatus Eremiobacteraeota bacterium]|nr:ABC transporter ATP-binding protein [Candidatus Eremiobacteraeota bacterium]MBV8366384.1 ABC transporter ATP-binding protein [Candidatus Eremiobacteraeota bacterium]
MSVRAPLAVAVRNVRMTYRIGSTRVEALRGVSLDVPAGEFLLLMGPSGSGKTTLLSILGGILTPTSGAVVVAGVELTRLNRRTLAEFRLHNVGFVFQGFNLFGALSARENVQLALSLKGVKASEGRERACGLLDEVGLGDKCERAPADLSAGEKQRVAIARALAGAPRLIMADEPTASLDSDNGKHITLMLRELAKSHGCTVITVTHDPRIVEVADRVLNIEDGFLRE